MERKYELWVVTRQTNLVWATRTRVLSSAVFKTTRGKPYPAIDESDLGLSTTCALFFYQATVHPTRRRIIGVRKGRARLLHAEVEEEWRPFIKRRQNTMLRCGRGQRQWSDAGTGTPLQVLVIAEMMGVPDPARPYIRTAEEAIKSGRGDPEPDEPLDRRA